MLNIIDKFSGKAQLILLPLVTAAGWIVPGAGFWIINEKKRAAIVFVTILITFLIGIYAGSIGVIDAHSDTPGLLGTTNPWFLAQILNSPLILFISNATAAGSYPVYGKPAEIGQLYTSISGLLNLLCILNCAYLAHVKCAEKEDNQ